MVWLIYREIRLIVHVCISLSLNKQIAEWGADGVIIGSAMVKQLGEATSPKEGLKRLKEYARSMKNALP